MSIFLFVLSAIIAVVAFWPGMGSYDSLWTVEVASGVKPLNPGLSYAYIALVKFSLFLLGNHGLVIIVQFLSLSYSLIFIIYSLLIRNIYSNILLGSVMFSPPFLMLSFGLWKDGLYIAGFILLVGVFVNILTNSRIDEKVLILNFILGLFLCLSFRPNGFLSVFGILVSSILVFGYRNFKINLIYRRFSIISFFFSLSFIILNFYVPNKLQHETWHMKANTFQTFYQDLIKPWQIGSINLTKSDQEYLDSFGDKGVITSQNQCEMANTLYGVASFSPFLNDESTLLKIWFKALKQDPGRILESRICRASNLIKPFPRTNTDSNGFEYIPFPYFAGQWSEGNVGPAYFVPNLTKLFQKYIQISWSPLFVKLVWWAGLYVWLSLILYFINKRFNPKPISLKLDKVITFLVVNNIVYTITASLIIPATDFRFGFLPQFFSIVIIYSIILGHKFNNLIEDGRG